MANFMLLLQETPGQWTDYSPEQLQGIVQEYIDWRQKIADRGNLVDGQKLTEEGGRRLSQTNGSVRVVDGPYSEAKEVLGGFFMIKAGDYDEAVKLSRDCPHLKYGGAVEVRQVDEHHS